MECTLSRHQSYRKSVEAAEILTYYLFVSEVNSAEEFQY